MKVRAVICLLLFLRFFAGASEKGEAFAREAEARIQPQPNVRGDDKDWFFLVKELRHLSTGRFWESSWQEVAVHQTDPIPSMVEFNEQLLERGIRLVVVPVPPKAAMYPEKLAGEFVPGDAFSTRPFLEKLLESGINVIDLETGILRARAEDDSLQWYCQQDAHFSPHAVERITGWILENQGREAVETGEFTLGEEETLSITGDQVKDSEWEGRVPAEPLSVRPVFQNGSRGITPDPAGRVLLLGDSHTLVFHQGKAQGMHCRGAGLADHLSHALGSPVDLVGVRGSGLVQARKQLFFHASEHPGYWDNKQLVIWVFSMREITQSADRIDRIEGLPLTR